MVHDVVVASAAPSGHCCDRPLCVCRSGLSAEFTSLLCAKVCEEGGAMVPTSRALSTHISVTVHVNGRHILPMHRLLNNIYHVAVAQSFTGALCNLWPGSAGSASTSKDASSKRGALPHHMCIVSAPPLSTDHLAPPCVHVVYLVYRRRVKHPVVLSSCVFLFLIALPRLEVCGYSIPRERITSTHGAGRLNPCAMCLGQSSCPRQYTGKIHADGWLKLMHVVLNVIMA